MRRKTELTAFNDGIVEIFAAEDHAEPGKMPLPALERKCVLRFHERTVGITRFFAALQSVGEIRRVVRCQRVESVSPHDVAMINGASYRIVQVQYPEGIMPKAMDIALIYIDRTGRNA